MKRRIVAGLAALALAFSLTACGPQQEQQCVDRNGTKYVCEEDDDDDVMPFIVPMPVGPSKPKTYKAPSYKAPAYRAPKSYSFRSK